MPVGVITKDDSNDFCQREWFHSDFNRVVAPFRIAGNQNWVGLRAQFVDQMLLQIRITTLVSHHPGIHVGNRVSPRPERNSAIRQIVVLLDGAI